MGTWNFWPLSGKRAVVVERMTGDVEADGRSSFSNASFSAVVHGVTRGAWLRFGLVAGAASESIEK